MLTDNEQIIAIAKLDGWTTFVNEPLPSGCFAWDEHGQSRSEFKPYLTSRDAIIPVIERCCESWELKPRFIRALELIRYDNEPPIRTEDSIWEFGYGEAFEIIIEATPRQLAEALLRVTNKWKEK